MEKKNENGKVQLKGQLKLYIQWPAIMGIAPDRNGSVGV